MDLPGTVATDTGALSRALRLANLVGSTVKIDIREAATQLCKLGGLAWQDEDVVIARDGEPYLYLLPYRGLAKPRGLGDLKGQIRMARDFDETPQDVIDSFEGKEGDNLV